MAINDLKDKWVLVTGAASGIGLETARAFANEWANLILVDLNELALLELGQTLAARGIRCLTHVLDVSDERAVHDMAAKVTVQIGGAPHVLVNNAGVGYLGPLLDTPTSAWRHVLDVNLMGVVHMCQAFLPSMLKPGRTCHIVNVASAAGIMAAPNLSAYSASKHAVVGLHDALVMELAGFRVGLSLVCPGVINTPIVRNRGAISAVVPKAQMDKIEAYYRRNGAAPAVVGNRIVRAVKTGEDLVLVGPTAKALDRIKRISPKLARKATLAGCKVNGYWWPYASYPFNAQTR